MDPLVDFFGGMVFGDPTGSTRQHGRGLHIGRSDRATKITLPRPQKMRPTVAFPGSWSNEWSDQSGGFWSPAAICGFRQARRLLPGSVMTSGEGRDIAEKAFPMSVLSAWSGELEDLGIAEMGNRLRLGCSRLDSDCGQHTNQILAGRAVDDGVNLSRSRETVVVNDISADAQA